MFTTISSENSSVRFHSFLVAARSFAMAFLFLWAVSPGLCAESGAEPSASTAKQRWTWSEEKQRVVAITEKEDLAEEIPSFESNAAVQTEQKSSDSTKRMQIRQGSELISVIGNFRDAGDRIIFYSGDGSLRLVVLENLSLERVGKILAFTPEELLWQVSGEVTEFENQNYLLLRRAVLQSSNFRIPLDGNN